MNRRYVVRRLLQAVLTLVGILVAFFVLLQLAPGDVTESLGEGTDPAGRAALRAELGLDRSILSQLLSFGGRALRGDLGVSILQNNRPVTDILGEHLPPTLLLMGTALVVSTTFGIALGCRAARRPQGLFDAGSSFVALIAYAIPSFWLGQMAILLLAFRLNLLPLTGMTDSQVSYTGLDHAVDVATHLALPALVLAASEVALVYRVTRAGLLEEAQKDYLRTARAKGVAEGDVLNNHAFRNALLPLVTIIGNRVGFLFSGAVVVEGLFAWPGLGSLLVSATQQRDGPVVMGGALVVSFAIVTANLVTDLLYASVDPRIRL